MSLSNIFFVFLSHNLQLSGLISSASIILLLYLPNSNLKSTKIIPILENNLINRTLIFSANFVKYLISLAVACLITLYEHCS